MTARAQSADPILQVQDLHVEFDTYGGIVKAVRGVSFDVHPGKTLAIVGESGCGKSVTVQAVMGLIPMPPGRITRGAAILDGTDIIRKKIVGGDDVRGSRLGMIFQDAMTSLNPTMTIGDQIAETLQVHRGYSRPKALARAVELIAQTKIPEPEQRARQYPFSFSGGMLQRAMIAMSIACEPDVLIADEPTTALDVTVQAQILELLQELQRGLGMSILLITHDLGVVAETAHRVVVMYAGAVVERANVDDLFEHPRHPYTAGLMLSLPRLDSDVEALRPIEGAVPDALHLPTGCRFHPRCPLAMPLCRERDPELVERGTSPERPHASACFYVDEHPSADLVALSRKGRAA
jgi:oligopeptide/dipeptide ABC transporter ATP-binding protein